MSISITTSLSHFLSLSLFFPFTFSHFLNFNFWFNFRVQFLCGELLRDQFSSTFVWRVVARRQFSSRLSQSQHRTAKFLFVNRSSGFKWIVFNVWLDHWASPMLPTTKRDILTTTTQESGFTILMWHFASLYYWAATLHKLDNYFESLTFSGLFNFSVSRKNAPTASRTLDRKFESWMNQLFVLPFKSRNLSRILSLRCVASLKLLKTGFELDRNNTMWSQKIFEELQKCLRITQFLKVAANVLVREDNNG